VRRAPKGAKVECFSRVAAFDFIPETASSAAKKSDARIPFTPLPEPAWAGKAASSASKQSATSVFTTEQTRIFAAYSFLLRCSHAS
jgi:hypothetical protein